MTKVFKKIMLVTAFLVAIVVFLVGLYAGFILDSYRVGDADSEIRDTRLDTDSFIVERDFFDTFEVENCEILNNRMQVLGNSLGEIGKTLTKYDSRRLFYTSEYQQLKRQYFLLEIRAYTIRKQMSDLCPDDNSHVVLFFYDTEGNQESLNQGYALDTLTNQNDNLVVFSFDKDFNETALISLIDYYNVSYAPTMIWNFEEKIESYTPVWVLRERFIQGKDS